MSSLKGVTLRTHCRPLTAKGREDSTEQQRWRLNEFPRLACLTRVAAHGFLQKGESRSSCISPKARGNLKAMALLAKQNACTAYRPGSFLQEAQVQICFNKKAQQC